MRGMHFLQLGHSSDDEGLPLGQAALWQATPDMMAVREREVNLFAGRPWCKQRAYYDGDAINMAV